MSKKKITVEVPEEEAEQVVKAIDDAETASGEPVVEPTVEDVADSVVDPVEPVPAPADLPVVQTADETPAVVPQDELPTNAHTYYVSKDGVFDKFFTNEDYKGEALKFAKEYAESVGGSIEASGIYQ